MLFVGFSFLFPLWETLFAKKVFIYEKKFFYHPKVLLLVKTDGFRPLEMFFLSFLWSFLQEFCAFMGDSSYDKGFYL